MVEFHKPCLRSFNLLDTFPCLITLDWMLGDEAHPRRMGSWSPVVN